MNSTDEADQGWMRSSTCRAADDEGRIAGHAYGLAQSFSRTLAGLLSRQARQKFGAADADDRATLYGLARAFATDPLMELGDRLITSSSWKEWLAGVIVPPPAADMPAYTKDLEIDLDPSGPSIDSYFQVELDDGETIIAHVRIQKEYQPDLDRHLFEASRKMERKHGKMPTVGVFLTLPSAEGPGMTGRFEERDASGNLTRVFTYIIHRAWEMTAEEVTRGIGTMLLAPLTRGSRERMPEIVRLIKEGLDRNNADAHTRELAWVSVYWNMGFILDLDDVHRALGDILPFIQSAKHYLDAKGHAFVEAYSEAQQEGRLQAGRDLVTRQATIRFGPDETAAAAIAAITEPDDLDTLAGRALTAADWISLLTKS